MAHAFYIPNQAALLRRTYLQEQEQERQRDDWKTFWRLLLTIFYELLHQYVLFERRTMGSCRPTRFL
ncbi:cell death protein rpr [Zeugodacus cucurbitae]|uniref:cell death protein rpr n=1 Tax=Zeugodacus cucurbitae TaxID=28588 RepID=UPI0023D96252|nr:cell death protein rpr [Zeugodacus cucurbitae]